MTTIYYLTVFWTLVHSFEKLSKYIIAYYIQGFPGGSEGKASVCNAGDRGLIPGSGRSPEEGNGNPLQYSCLENPTDRGAWQATVHGVTKTFTFTYDLMGEYMLSHFNCVRLCATL